VSFGEDIVKLVRESQNQLHAAAPWWSRTSLGNVVQILNGFPFDSKHFGEANGYRLIRIRDVTSGDTETFYSGEIPDGYWVNPGDIVVGMDGDFNLRVWATEPGLLNQRVCKLIPDERVLDPSFLAYVLPGYLRLINENTPSVTVRHLSSRTLQQVPIPLPPLTEQRRIVARIEALFARTRRARVELERLGLLAERYRSSSLLSVLSGQGARVAATDAGPAQPPGDSDLAGVWPFEELPAGWLWAPFSELFDDKTSSHKKLPQKSYLSFGRFPVIDQGESDIGGWSDDEGIVYDGALPAIIFGDHTRAVKFVDEPFVQGADGVKVLVPRRGRLSPSYAFWVLRGLPLPDKGYARHTKFLRASYFPIPPLEDQPEIARRIQAAQSAADVAARECARALALLDRLEQSILIRAFRGELVPQDPHDEPAKVELEKLRHALATAGRGRPRKKTMPATDALVAPRKKGPAVPKNRTDADVKGQPYLANHLRQIGSAATTEDLYKAADLSIADFYKQLSEEVAKGWVKDASGKLEAA
jgi:type I restriction enzyme S subunit